VIRLARPRRRVAVSDRGGIPVCSVGGRPAWDAGDLTRLATAVNRLAARRSAVGPAPRPRTDDLPAASASGTATPAAVGIDMTSATRLPPGFWERLCRWTEEGLRVYLFAPEPEVRAMAWFRLTARPVADGTYDDAYEICCGPRRVERGRNPGGRDVDLRRTPRCRPDGSGLTAVAESAPARTGLF
jgi:hypothetical protein